MINEKEKRHKFIIESIENKKIKTQDDLLKILINNKYIITQATLSRDLNLLKAGKYVDTKGERYYRIRKNEEDFPKNSYDIISIEFSLNICVLKIKSGYANITALKIDESGSNIFLGTIAGDDTVLIIIKEKTPQQDVKLQLKQLGLRPF